MLYLSAFLTVLVEDDNQYCQHIQQWSSPTPEINEYEMLLFYGSYSNGT
jgi:hypothetical protein